MKIFLLPILAFLMVGCDTPGTPAPIDEPTDAKKERVQTDPEPTVEDTKKEVVEVEVDPELETEDKSSEMPPISDTNESPKVTITKFFDFACGYCRRGAQTMQYLQEQFGDAVEVEFRHFVVHPSVLKAHKASECAAEQGLFEDFFYEYFDNHFAQTSEKAFQTVNEKVGVDQTKFDACLATDRTIEKIEGHRMMGQLIGITGTPNFVINNETKIPGALPEKEFEKLVRQYLEKS